MSSPYHPIRSRRPPIRVDLFFDPEEHSQRREPRQPSMLSLLPLVALLYMRN